MPPVKLPATPEWAEKLGLKIHTLILVIKPFFEDDENELIH